MKNPTHSPPLTIGTQLSPNIIGSNSTDKRQKADTLPQTISEQQGRISEGRLSLRGSRFHLNRFDFNCFLPPLFFFLDFASVIVLSFPPFFPVFWCGTLALHIHHDDVI